MAEFEEHIFHELPNLKEDEFNNSTLNDPFSYLPDELSLKAVNHLQHYLIHQQSWQHDFGIHGESKESLGKMFGILVVKTPDDKIGYLAAFSGKIAEMVNLPGFVPPIFDMLNEQGFFRKGERELNELTREINLAEEHPEIIGLKQKLELVKAEAETKIQKAKEEYRQLKSERKNLRDSLLSFESEAEKDSETNRLNNESRNSHRNYKETVAQCQIEVSRIELILNEKQSEVIKLKAKRKSQSSALQVQLFKQYSFYNKDLKSESLETIFTANLGIKPPSGAGDCGAPKLFQFAFKNQMQPIRIAEFWWGKTPSAEIRKHGSFYPSCRGKCEPILKHMLDGLKIDLPLNKVIKRNTPLDIIYEDQHLLLVDKPENMLSVPGKIVAESVYEVLQRKYGSKNEVFMVHRLDMATSGLLLVAKNIDVYKQLQKQFAERKIQKEYLAILEGIPDLDEGQIDLPLNLDHYDRPRQLVDFKEGKESLTYWKKLEEIGTMSKVLLIPYTGRTHQLRVHMAHHKGMGIPIKGDNLYGNISDRLYLHAKSLAFMHPVNQKLLSFKTDCPF